MGILIVMKICNTTDLRLYYGRWMRLDPNGRISMSFLMSKEKF